MQLKPLLPDLDIRFVSKVPVIENPLFSNGQLRVTQDEFILEVPATGEFYAAEGKIVRIAPIPGADPELINLHLNGVVLAAILHQRKILSLHSSSFVFKERGILVAGETGSGKSSLAASFSIGGGKLVSDDISAIVFRDGLPVILPLNREIRIRKDTALALDLNPSQLPVAEGGSGKYIIRGSPFTGPEPALDQIIILSAGEVAEPQFSVPDPSAAFALLRSEVCSWEMLAGMPDSEASFLSQLVNIVEKVPVIRVVRPAGGEVKKLYKDVKGIIPGEQNNLRGGKH